MSNETNAMAFADGQKKALRAKIADLEASRSRLLAALTKIADGGVEDGKDYRPDWLDYAAGIEAFARLVVEAEKGEGNG